MNRAPIYSKDKSHRIISVANGLWAFQRFAGKTQRRNNTLDPWINERRPTDYATALGQLKTTEPA